MKIIAAIIVTYNPEVDLLIRQNHSLNKQVDWLIYVDNCSKDIDVIDSLKSEKTIIIRNNCNLGLAKAQNQGIEQARIIGADAILLFDQDSVPPPFFLQELIKIYENENNKHKVALVGPAIRNFTLGSNKNDEGVIFKGIHIKHVKLQEATLVSYCIASGSFIPMTAINIVGEIKEDLFIDGLDVEWCLRAQSKGYKVIQTNKTYIEHCIGDGTSRRILSHSPQREYYIMRNAIWMSKQDYIPLGYRVRKALFSIGRLMQAIARFKFKYIKADILGLRDGIWKYS